MTTTTTTKTPRAAESIGAALDATRQALDAWIAQPDDSAVGESVLSDIGEAERLLDRAYQRAVGDADRRREPEEREANARLIAAAPELVGWLAIAHEMLVEYRDYGEAMREHGRGFSPTASTGHEIGDAVGGIGALLAGIDGGAQ